tara:strand:- start:125722 stop:127947 length:2226 start_codon:yes stop_codon:yes gene_type:complete
MNNLLHKVVEVFFGSFENLCIAKPLVFFFLVSSALIAAKVNEIAAEDKSPSNPPVILSADKISYDELAGLVKAIGNVEVSQAGRILMADSITYNQSNDVMTANGNVALMEVTGEVAFADYVQLKDQMKMGVLKNLRVILDDESRISANFAKRSDGNRTEMSKAVYSPCELCEDNPEEPPLWQIKANKVVHDQKNRDISYYDAWMEFYGIPLIYTPYFEHPDPSVDRRSGFLAPSYSNSSSLGFELTTPYYWNIQPNRDLTFIPRLYSSGELVLGGEYREKLLKGSFKSSGSITYTDKLNDEGNEISGNEFRGHIFSEGNFQINPTWKWGYNFQRASDDTYLRRYRIDSQDTLTTEPFIEGSDKRRYVSAKAYFFQGLRKTDDQGHIPFILPSIDYSYTSNPGWAGSFSSINANIMLLQRLEGADSRRISIEGSWNLPMITQGGHIWTSYFGLRGDIYHVNNVENKRNPSAKNHSGITGRIRPEVMVEWRYPLVAKSGTTRQVVEPVVQTIISPYGGNPAKIPNEDSQNFEFNDSNLFSRSRFTGLDRLESGPRINYGLRYGIYGKNGGRTTALIGQSARLKDDDTFGSGSGLEDTFSDYVGKISIEPTDYFSFNYRFRLDRLNGEARRNEINFAGGRDYLRLNIGYALLEKQLSEVETSGFANREEMAVSATSQFAKFWSADANLRHNLTGSGGTISWSTGIKYEDECFIFNTQYGRTFTEDREVKPDSTLIFRVLLKNLG